MSVAELLHTLAGLNVRFKLDEDRLKINAPKGVLTADLQEQIKLHKDNLIEWLNRSTTETHEQSLPQIVPDLDNLYEPFPLSDLQVAFYLANDPFMEFQVRPHFYMESNHEKLDVLRYEQAWDKALQRHKKELVLVNSQRQLQTLREVPPVKCKINDLRHLTKTQVETQLLSIRNSLMREELDLNQWPWFELQVSLWNETGIEKARIHYNNNNFFSDGFGGTRLLKEVWCYYEDPTFTLPPIELSFRDAVLGLEQLAESDIGKKAQHYWLSRLEELPSPPPLPQIPDMNRRCRSKLQRREAFFSVEIWESFKKNSAYFGLTTSNAILAAYAEVLATWSGTRHFILSHMMTRRLLIHPQIKDIVGNFASLYPLEVDLRGDVPFVKRAVRVQEQVLRDANHAQWGGMRVMQALNRHKDEMGTSPCPFVVGSGIFMGPYKKPDFDCLETSQTQIDHQFWELEDGRFYAVWDLLEEFFPHGMIDSMWQAYQNLFQQLALSRDAWEEHHFDLVPANNLLERQKINDCVKELPIALLNGCLRYLPESQKNQLALLTPNNELSYGELQQWSYAIAAELLKKNVSTNDTVAVVMDRGPELLASIIGILHAGAAYVPIVPSLPGERLQYLLSDSDARLVITQIQYQESLQEITKCPTVVVDQFHQLITDNVQFPVCSVNDLAYIIYTSGSTGKPKGVAINHRGAMNTVLDINQRFGVGPDDKIFGVSAVGFDLSVYDLFGSLLAGATLMYPEPDGVFNPAHWLEVINQHNITIWNSAPPLMSLLVETAQRQQLVLPSLRLVLLSGDWIPVGLPKLIRQIAPNAQIISLGGATEASVWSIYYKIDQVDKSWRSIPYGFPLTNQRWHILDSAGYPTPVWTPGELYIAGDGLAMGYWKDNEKTANSFIKHPLTGERIYKTGDQGRYLPDGCIEFLGRSDSQVKIQGHRIELGEIEMALREHPNVAEVIVMARDTSEHNVKKLVACVIPEQFDSSVSPDDYIGKLQSFLKKKLPAYMIPIAWSIMDSFPVTSNGKIDRKALECSETTQTDGTSNNKSKQRIAPRNYKEQQLISIWSQVLEQDINNFGVCDDFFELGGQSFDAVRVIGLVKEKLGYVLSLGDMWQQRSIENLVKLLVEDLQPVNLRLMPIDLNGEGNPCFLVHPAGGYCLRYSDLGSLMHRPVYGFQAVGVDGRETPQERIEDIAALYIKEMRQQQSSGPYLIGGWSSGGLIAFEMAVQLRKQGEEVERVILFDCPSPHEHQSVSNTQMLYWFLEDMDLDLPLSLLENYSWDHLSAEQQLAQAIDVLKVANSQPLDAGLLQPIYAVFSQIVRAGRKYYPPTIDVKLCLYRAVDNVVSEFARHPYGDREDWGWGLMTSFSMQCHILPGSHHTLLTPGYVEPVADLLNQWDHEATDFKSLLAERRDLELSPGIAEPSIAEHGLAEQEVD